MPPHLSSSSASLVPPVASSLFPPESAHTRSFTTITTDAGSADIPLLDFQNDRDLPPTSSSSSSSGAISSFLRPSTWLFEILGLSTASASCVALTVLLLHYDEKRNPSWAAGITFNAVVSWLSTTFRISLLVPVSTCISQLSWISFTQKVRSLEDLAFYDSASRGPLGSVKLIFRGKTSKFAKLGAVLTLLAIAVGPFFQQTVEFVSQSDLDSGQISQTSAAYTYNGSIGLSGNEISTYYGRLPYNMRSAMYSGLLSSSMVPLPDPPYLCNGGNCTWPSFGTLAIGTKCGDISSSVKLDISRDPEGSLDPPAYEFAAATTDNITKHLVEGAGPQNVMILQSHVNIANRLSTWGWAPFDTSNTTAVIALVEWVKALDNIYYSAGDSTYLTEDTTFEAVRCYFYVGVREISANVLNGTYHEDILNEVVQAENFTGNLNEYLDSPDVIFRPAFSRQIVNGEFKLPFITYQTFVSAIANMFGYDIDNNVTAAHDTIYFGPETLRMLYTADNTTKAMGNLAHYMTIALRANDTTLLRDHSGNSSIISPSQAIKGVVVVQKVFIRVRWVWLSLPVALVALVTVLLFHVIMKSRPDQVGTWKSSPLALLLHAESRNDAHGYRVMPTADAVQAVAAEMEMQILKDGKGGHLVRTRPVDSKIR